LHLDYLVEFGATVQNDVEDGLVEVEELLRDFPQQGDGFFNHAYFAHGSD